jgi:hypothetical protein
MIGVIRIPRFIQHSLLDVKLGFALMRDRRVPWRSKLAAILMGLLITGVVEGLEIPIEGVLSMLLPLLGAAGDMVLDGVEMIAGPILISAALLPFMAPRDVVAKVRSERAAAPGAAKSPIIDV